MATLSPEQDEKLQARLEQFKDYVRRLSKREKLRPEELVDYLNLQNQLKKSLSRAKVRQIAEQEEDNALEGSPDRDKRRSKDGLEELNNLVDEAMADVGARSGSSGGKDSGSGKFSVDLSDADLLAEFGIDLSTDTTRKRKNRAARAKAEAKARARSKTRSRRRSSPGEGRVGPSEDLDVEDKDPDDEYLDLDRDVASSEDVEALFDAAEAQLDPNAPRRRRRKRRASSAPGQGEGLAGDPARAGGMGQRAGGALGRDSRDQGPQVWSVDVDEGDDVAELPAEGEGGGAGGAGSESGGDQKKRSGLPAWMRIGLPPWLRRAIEWTAAVTVLVLLTLGGIRWWFGPQSSPEWKQVEINTTADLLTVMFVTRTEGLTAGTGGTIFRSPDGGKTWDAVRPKLKPGRLARTTFYSLGRSPTGQLWLVGSGGLLLASVDQGNQWRPIRTGTKRDLRAIVVLDKKRALLLGDRVAVQTRDAGKTWSTARLKYPVDPAQVKVTRAIPGFGHIWAVAEGRGLIGQKYPFMNRRVVDVAFFDAKHGYAMTENRLCKTTTGGAGTFTDWSCRKLGTASERFVRLRFFGARRGYALGGGAGIATAFGYGGVVLHTDDAGKTWQRFPRLTTRTFRDIYFLGDKSGWIVGDKGTLFRYVPRTGPEE